MVGHLRDPLRRDERGRLDRGQARGAEALDQLELHLGRDFLLLVLQAVARPHLDDANARGQRHAASSSSNCAPSLTCSPAAKWIFLILPSRGAVMVCSIFIASR